MDRRTLLKGAAVASGAALIGSRAGTASAQPYVNFSPISRSAMKSIEGRSPIEHVVCVMMENRSFDHFMGWLPGANGIGVDPDGHVVDHERFESFEYRDKHGKKHRPFHTTQLSACGEADQDHGYSGGRTQWNHGKMDGFVQDPENTAYALSYYLAAARQFSTPLAMNYTTCDNYFCSYLGPTWPNRFFQHAAQTDRLNDDLSPEWSDALYAPSPIPSIWDQMSVGGPTGKYYFSDLPFLGLWGLKHIAKAAPVADFFVDAATGNLPNFCMVDPRFEGEGNGITNDDHPLADLRGGDAFLSDIFHALANGPNWSKTLLVINYDEWGGFFDHVAPPMVAAANQLLDTENVIRDRKTKRITKVLAGFRVPCILASPYTKGSPDKPRISSYAYDHTSVLRFVEWNWGLHAITPRDASIPFSGASKKHLSNLRYAMDFSNPRTKVPDLPQASPFLTSGCDLPILPPGGVPLGAGGQAAAPARPAWTALRKSELMKGWL